MKKTISILLALLLVFGTTAFALTANAEGEPTIVDQGYCGSYNNPNDVVWVLTDDGTLTVSGTGAMADYASYTDVPWHPYSDSMQTLVVENGVTSIGDKAFYLCGSLKDITLPTSLRNIGDGAFIGTGIEQIVIPEGVETLPHAVFSECFYLKQISLPLSLKTIVDSAFYEGDIHILAYPGTMEQLEQIEILYPGEDADELAGMLQRAYQNYLDGHELFMEEEVTSAPTCQNEGRYCLRMHCTKCNYQVGYEFGEGTIPPLNHRNAYEVAATEATATAHGYTAGVYCPDCGTWRSGHDVIHNHLGAQTVIKEPTETEEGLVDIVCTVCGETGRYTVAPTGAQPDENSGGFWQQITGFFRGIIDWFLRLFKWLG